MTLIEEITHRLQCFAPTLLEISDDSALHAGHKGNGGGGHFSLNIASSQFCDKSQIMRHRLIYEVLADLIPLKIHALSINAQASEPLITEKLQ